MTTMIAASRSLLFVIAVFLIAMALGQRCLVAAESWQAAGKSGAVAAGGAKAVEAGLGTLKAGGNAADAAAATILALTVTDSQWVCFGGEVPLIVYDAKENKVEVIAGQGVAPRLATRDYFLQKGGIPGTGVEPAAVPALLDAVVKLLQRHGTRTFADSAAPTLALLDKHEKNWHADLARTVRRLCAAEQESQGDRSQKLQAVSDYFYRGPLAHELADWSAAHGGLLRYEDLAAHVTRIEEPVSADYRGYQVLKCGPWTQGPCLLESLRLLEGFDLKSLGHNQPETIHLTVEALKLALADRDVYYADPECAQVPLAALLSDSYTTLRHGLIDRQHASLQQRPGDPLGGRAILDPTAARRGLGGPDHDTTTCLVADASGNVVAATPSGWDGVVAGETGVWLGTRLQSFNLWPDHPNCIAPDKRPRITLTPTLVLKDGKPALAVSVAGGDGQDQTTLQLLLNVIDFGLSPAESVTAVRFGTNHHLGSFRQTPPELGSLIIDPAIGQPAIQALEALGHRVQKKKPPLWSPVMLKIDRATGQIEAAGDPKAGRHAAAY